MAISMEEMLLPAMQALRLVATCPLPQHQSRTATDLPLLAVVGLVSAVMPELVMPQAMIMIFRTTSKVSLTQRSHLIQDSRDTFRSLVSTSYAYSN
jgi:hypothetical protein